MCMVRVTNSLSHYQRILSQRTLTLTLQIKNLTQPNQTKQTRVGYETGPVVLVVVMYRKSQTVDLMEPIHTRLPDYKDLGHGVQ